MIQVIPFPSGLRVIDKKHTYFVKPPFFSLRKRYPHLKGRSLIIGFVGARGSGKSAGAAKTVVLDYLLKGKKVWSNMDIGVDLMVKGKITPLRARNLEEFSLIALDDMFHDGLVYLDEVNVNFAEARRAMSKTNVAFAQILQQIRHRKLDVIWSALSEMHCEERLRWGTDVFVQCSDISISQHNCGIGELSRWVAYDMSGVVQGKTPTSAQDGQFFTGVCWNKPWWNAFDTTQMQGMKKEEQPQEEELVADEEEDRSLDWLMPIATRIYNDPRNVIPAEDVLDLPEVQVLGIQSAVLNRALAMHCGIFAQRQARKGGTRIVAYTKNAHFENQFEAVGV